MNRLLETEQSERLYSRVAGRYDRVFERAILAEGRLTELTRQAMNGRQVLDLACGNGRWLDRFSPASYIGVDRNAAMLTEARHRFPAARFLRADMTALPFADETFEGLLSMFGAMGHLPPAGQAAMLREIHRVLQPGGLAILTNGNRWSPYVLPMALVNNHVTLEGVRFRVHSTTPRRFRDLLGRFSLLALESYDHSFVPIRPIQLVSALLGRDYRRDYGDLMDLYGYCTYVPGLQWLGKQLVAVCRKG